MDEKRDETEIETELDGDLAIDDETAGEVSGGHFKPSHVSHGGESVRPEHFKP